MNRSYDERLEQQLQEYEFAELGQLLPARPVFRHMPAEEDIETGTDAAGNRH